MVAQEVTGPPQLRLDELARSLATVGMAFFYTDIDIFISE
jgi:hypothetical protein